jgi:hypothetical protein
VSQGVLLSLLQQLGSDLASLPSNVLPWIREAALALDPQVHLQQITRGWQHAPPAACKPCLGHGNPRHTVHIVVASSTGSHPGGTHANDPGRALCSTAESRRQGCRFRVSHPAAGHPCGQFASHAVPLKDQADIAMCTCHCHCWHCISDLMQGGFFSVHWIGW